MVSDAVPLAAQEALWLTLKLGGVPLAALLAVGVLMSLVQAVTQINEQSLSFLPKLGALVLLVVLLGPAMAGTMRGYATTLFDRIVAVGGTR